MQVSASTSFATLASRTPASVVSGRRREDVIQCELVDGYGLCGGLATTGELVELMRPHWRQPGAVLTRWMLGHKVVSFPVGTLTLLPLFQFERPRFAPDNGVADATLVLADLMSDEDLAKWFLQPNQWLEQERPADVVAVDPELVLSAANRARHTLMARRFAN
jgi:hypothetical protein